MQLAGRLVGQDQPRVVRERPRDRDPLALGWAVNAFYAPVVHFDHLFAVDPGTDALLFGITLALGAVAGFFPARAATKVDPLDVLREA